MRLRPIFCLIAILFISIATAGGTTGVDPISAACLGCHNGSDAMHVRYCLIGQNKRCGGHIISAYYAELANQDNDLKPESSLPPEVALYEGKITCVTCHGTDPHLGQSLAMDNNRNSALCRACHLK